MLVVRDDYLIIGLFVLIAKPVLTKCRKRDGAPLLRLV